MDPYKVLGVSPSATDEEVKKACDMDNEEAVAVLNAAIARKKTIVCLSKGAESEATA